MTFAAVPLVCLDGRAETLQAALRYLLFALIGSASIWQARRSSTALMARSTCVLLSHRIRAEPATLVAAALMTVGLLAKTALVPLHLWLPPAHAGAPAAGSALLSAISVGQVILAEAGLSFIGAGVQSPDVTWGLLIAAGRKYLTVAWWTTLFPGLFVGLTVFALNGVARRFTDAGGQARSRLGAKASESAISAPKSRANERGRC